MDVVHPPFELPLGVAEDGFRRLDGVITKSGCQAVAIDTEGGKAVITGFCCVRDNFFPPDDIRERVSPLAGYPVIIPGIHVDSFKAYESVEKIKALADIIIPNHEPEFMDIETIP